MPIKRVKLTEELQTSICAAITKGASRTWRPKLSVSRKRSSTYGWSMGNATSVPGGNTSSSTMASSKLRLWLA